MTYALRAAIKRHVNITNGNITQITRFSTTTKAPWSLHAATRSRCVVPRPRSKANSQSRLGLGPGCQIAMSTNRPKEKNNLPETWELNSTDDVLASDTGPLSLVYPESVPREIPRIWIRDACSCERCVDPSSGQKGFSTPDIPDELPIAKARKTEDGSLEITWKDDFSTGDSHVSVYSAQQVQSYYFGRVVGKRQGKPNQTTQLWDKAEMEELDPFFDFNEFVKGGSEYIAALSQLHSHGIFFLRNVPHIENAVEKIAEKIGIIQETFYGRTWDVISKPNAENVAYTSSYLGLHADLLYMNDPPRIQLLHCLKNTCQGGDSTFSDGLRAAQQLRHLNLNAWSILSTLRIRYWYTKGVHQRSKHRPVVSDSDIYWSPPFQCPEQLQALRWRGESAYSSWIAAARQFKELLEDDKYQYQYKMKEGECVVFNNLRTLHGRREFDTSSGERWLKGTYVGSEAWEDKIREISPKLKNDKPTFPGKQAIVLNHLLRSS